MYREHRAEDAERRVDRATRPQGGDPGAVQSTGTGHSPQGRALVKGQGVPEECCWETSRAAEAEGPVGGQGLTMRVGVGVEK